MTRWEIELNEEFDCHCCLYNYSVLYTTTVSSVSELDEQLKGDWNAI